MKSRLIICALGLFVTSVPAAFIQTQSSQEKVEVQGKLVLSKVYKRTLAPEVNHIWNLMSKKGHCAGVEVEQRGIDILVRISDPSGRRIKEIDSPTGSVGTEKAIWITNIAGNWRVEIAPVEANQIGQYAIKLMFHRTATANDRTMVVADSSSNAAQLFYAQGEYKKAKQLFEQTRNLLEDAFGPDVPEVAAALTNLAYINEDQGDYAEAERLYQRALAIRQKIFGPNHPRFGESAGNLGGFYHTVGKYAIAESLYQQAMTILQQADETEQLNLATILNNFALLDKELGKYVQAESLYQQSLSIYEKALGADHPEVAMRLDNLANLYLQQGRYTEAEPRYKLSLEIMTKARGHEHFETSTCLNNLAGLYWNQGKYAVADTLYQRALAIRQKIFGQDHLEVAASLNNLATLYREQGRYADAEMLFTQAIAIVKRTAGPDHVDMAYYLHNLASAYWIQKRESEAKPLYRQALDIAKKALGPEHAFVAKIINNWAATCDELKQFKEADSLYTLAKAIQEEVLGKDHPDVALTLLNWGVHYQDQSRYAEAETLSQRAIEIFATAFGTNHPFVATGLNNFARSLFLEGGDKLDSALAQNERAIQIWNVVADYPNLRGQAYSLRAQLRKKKNDLNGALSDLAEALRVVDHLRPQIGGGEETRAGFFEKYSDHFSRMVTWQLEAGQFEKALEYSERGRTRVLLDQLAANKIDLRISIADSIRIPLEKRETDAKARFAEYQQRLTLLRSRKDLTPEEINKQIAELEGKLRAAYNDYQQIYEEIKNASPLWKELITKGGKPAALDTIQSQLVSQQSLMLIYQIGKEGSLLFVIPPTGQKPEVLHLQIREPVASILGVQAGPLKSTDLQKILAGQSVTRATGGLIQQLSRGIKIVQQKATPQLHALWQTLIPESLWPRLVSCSEIILLPDGVLSLLPFEALVVKAGKGVDDTRYWLDAGPVIRYAPSATTLYNIEQAKRHTSTLNQVALLSLSDPIYNPAEVVQMLQNPALAQISASASDTMSGGESIFAELNKVRSRDSYERVGGVLSRLPGTAQEAKALQNIFGEGLVVLNQLNATEPKLRAALSGKRYIHLATHGIVDQQQHSSLAALALTPPAGETTNAEDDGFLQLYEIYNLKIADCELAVLSACQTNVGKNFEGEGVFALSRGFLAAGARRVVASQWAVEDISTAELIGEFFRQIASAKKSRQQIDYARALRDAKRKIRRKKEWAAPYFWAPFVLTGKR